MAAFFIVCEQGFTGADQGLARDKPRALGLGLTCADRFSLAPLNPAAYMTVLPFTAGLDGGGPKGRLFCCDRNRCDR